MPFLGMEQQQRLSQVQSQVMSQQQIMTLKLLAMGSQDLRDEIYSQLEDNPALVLVKDPFSDGVSSVRKRTHETSQVHTSRVSAAGQLEADTYQQMLESSPDNRETLQEHLMHQLNMVNISQKEFELCKKLIENLDKNGFYILAPQSFLDDAQNEENQKLLQKCLSIVRKFDPSGICVQNVEESLLVQAEQKRDVPPLVFFLLNGHLQMLSNPGVEKVQKKIHQYIQEQEKLSFKTPDKYDISKVPSAKEIEKAITFIQALDPRPTRNFLDEQVQFVRPDVYVVRVKGLLEEDNLEKGLVLDDENHYFRLLPADDTIPSIQISPDFENKELTKQIKDSDQKKFFREKLSAAQAFINTLSFRQQIIVRSCSFLVKYQKNFFKKGPGYLAPLTQRQFAQMLDIHESSVSRLADSKFIHCDWGTFPLKYFFSSSLGKTAVQVTAKTESELIEKTSAEQNQSVISSNNVKFEIEKILKAQKEGEKKLSDQKIADMLAQKGISVARRTVAKYRSQLNIASSYDR